MGTKLYHLFHSVNNDKYINEPSRKMTTSEVHKRKLKERSPFLKLKYNGRINHKLW